ncbi:hypothetical protein GCM10023178_12250 [Actinomadura luteofluorescens]
MPIFPGDVTDRVEGGVEAGARLLVRASQGQLNAHTGRADQCAVLEQRERLFECGTMLLGESFDMWELRGRPRSPRH